MVFSPSNGAILLGRCACFQSSFDKFCTRIIYQETHQEQSSEICVNFFTAWCVLAEHHWGLIILICQYVKAWPCHRDKDKKEYSKSSLNIISRFFNFMQHIRKPILSHATWYTQELSFYSRPSMLERNEKLFEDLLHLTFVSCLQLRTKRSVPTLKCHEFRMLFDFTTTPKTKQAYIII